MKQDEYNDGLLKEINENKIDLIEYIDPIDLSEAIMQKGKWFDVRSASFVLEDHLANQE